MNKTVYENGKYCMQDVGTLYLGTKYTLGQLLEEEDISFKLRLLVEQYILPKADPEDTLETHLYFLERGSFLIKIYQQLKARVRINILEEKKTSRGSREEYTTKVMTVEKLAAMSPEEKEKRGVVVQELSVSKFALMAF